ncbi:MOSC domain-containing protein [Actinomadura hibisca]|uniref:MOSC domain-containing protein n=1 Tax=Actinomadura hibisca TaxID=68565 RepID=UPI000831EF05|nr:MOSC N-terminal beta barrel domain-containing protein [Actinomadura hibisca]
MAVISDLITYPVKGCAGTSLESALLTPAGLAHDRAYMVVGPDGTFRSQRRDPLLATVRPTASASALTLAAPGMEDLRVETDTTGPRRDVILFGTPYQGIDQGDPAAAWLTDVLRTPSRLVRVPSEHHRVTDGLTPGTAAYADGGALHILSRATLAELNRRLDEPLPMARFRPNIVIDGWDEPHREDLARHLAIGDTELAYAKLALRCAVTLVDQEQGTKAGREPLRTLATYRRASGGGVAFGVKFSVLRTGKLSVGDAVDVRAWADPNGLTC